MCVWVFFLLFFLVYTNSLTIDRNSEEQSVGDVDHYTAQEVQSIHVA